MPATEQTWRDIKPMHVVFGTSAALMLLATIWMLAADHQREWKGYQRQFRDVETWTAQARVSQQQDAAWNKELDKRKESLKQAQSEVPPLALLQDFRKELDNDPDQSQATFNPQEQYDAIQAAAPEDRAPLRKKLLDAMNHLVIEARFRENHLADEKKFRSADLDVARSQYELAVGEAAPAADLERLQKKVDEVKQSVEEKNLLLQEATTHRKNLEAIVAKITARETQAKKQLEDHLLLVQRLETARDERSYGIGKQLLELPIIDAFGRPLKIEQIWLPHLTINYNFRDVARFDRCVTCHQAIDRTAPGSAIEPGYRPRRDLKVRLATPAQAPPGATDSPDDYAQKIQQAYGLQFAARGLLDDDDVTVSVVQPESPAAKSGLAVGDVILKIGDVDVLDQVQVHQYLIDNVSWGKPLELVVRRGLPNPFVSHPRLDLFVGSISPHKMGDIGCTICHEGQGSATSFKWASHTPNDPGEAERWHRDYGWFNNHHWIFPMNPRRFAQSSCLKCHHDVTELEPSEKFPDPPAKTLMAGYNHIRQYGCFGCHEINGFDGPHKRIGPDMRAEPNVSAACQALLALDALTGPQRELATRLVGAPQDDSARHRLLESIRNPAPQPADQPAAAPPEKKAPNNGDTVAKLSTLLEDVESPGQLRKVGPSLRHVADKLDFDFIYSWVRRPADFRPDTKMPQFFGLWDHLDGKGLAESKRFEPVEIRGIAAYLLAKSQPFAFAQPSRGVTTGPSEERGKKLFETRGCLACHKHRDFPKAQMEQGPDLSRIGDKLGRAQNKHGRQWLYSWLRNPSNYHPRTLMPNLMLDPIVSQGQTIDPAADIAAFLLKSTGPGGEAWQQFPNHQLSQDERSALHDLALLHLKDKFPFKQAEGYLETGIPLDRRSEVKGDEVELLGNVTSTPERDRMLLQYVGRRTISKFGCSGCHDVPGFEDVKPIGTGLADWGRKGTDKLAFEQIVQYLLSKEHGAPAHEHEPVGAAATPDATAAAAHHGFDFLAMPPERGYYMKSLVNHERPGFIWQKLRAPRSYDYKKTENKGYNERLRMPKFTAFDEQDREAVITFVLGLVAEPPATQYVYNPDPRQRAIRDGGQVVEKYNCKGCHTLQMDRWNLAYQPDDFNDPPPVPDYSFFEPHVTPQQVKASLQTDLQGRRHATIVGMPTVSEETGQPLRFDEDRAPIEPGDTQTKAYYSFVLWDNALINGHTWQAGVQNLLVPESAIVKDQSYPAVGGYLPRLIFPSVVADEKRDTPNVKGDEAWGWLPPPLVHEGRKVRSDWLHGFLLDPYPIRPATVLRMPKFNMSSQEADKLVAYFAAVDGVDSLFDADPRNRADYLAAQESAHPHLMGDALRIVTDNNYCIKCHLVGDFTPTGSERAKAPRLDQVYKRLRPEFTHDWIANPKRILPYTAMPVNIPYDKPVSQQLFRGNSRAQLNGVVDLLSNYDRFVESQVSIKPLIKAPPPAGGAPAAGSAATPRGPVR